MARSRNILWALTIGLVLADSSIVTLALPEILRTYDSSVFAVSWVLTAYNVVLGVAVIPLARRARRNPVELWGGGLVLFALASAACAVAPSLEVLLGARCIQAVGGAAVIGGAIELLSRSEGSHRAAAGIWGAAATAGLALGPTVGGLLTELLSWEAIFVLQIPVLAALVAARMPERHPEPGPTGELDRRPEIGLALISAGLTAALFLLVILLTEGWGMTPLGAALVVSIMPAAALIAGRLRFAEPGTDFAIAGAIATAGGLAALGLLPGADAGLTVIPQILIGIGLALCLPVLTGAALRRRDPDGSRAAETLAARHLGIVLGLIVLTPVLSLQLESEQEAGRNAGTALLLDAPISATSKIAVADELADLIDKAEAEGQLPDIRGTFDSLEVPEEDAAGLQQLEDGVNEQVDRAATHAFSWPFLGAALLAALALVPLISLRRSRL